MTKYRLKEGHAVQVEAVLWDGTNPEEIRVFVGADSCRWWRVVGGDLTLQLREGGCTWLHQSPIWFLRSDDGWWTRDPAHFDRKWEPVPGDESSDKPEGEHVSEPPGEPKAPLQLWEVTKGEYLHWVVAPDISKVVRVLPSSFIEGASGLRIHLAATAETLTVDGAQ